MGRKGPLVQGWLSQGGVRSHMGRLTTPSAIEHILLKQCKELLFSIKVSFMKNILLRANSVPFQGNCRIFYVIIDNRAVFFDLELDGVGFLEIRPLSIIFLHIVHRTVICCGHCIAGAMHCIAWVGERPCVLSHASVPPPNPHPPKVFYHRLLFYLSLYFFVISVCLESFVILSYCEKKTNK